MNLKNNTLSKIKCPICNTKDYNIIYKSNLDKELKKEKIKQFTYATETRRIGQIVKCKACGLVYVNPQEKNIEKLYKETEDKNYELSREARKITFEDDLNEIEKIKIKGKLLDIGCSTGIFLEVAKKRSWNIYGVELSKWGYQKAKKITPNIYNKTLDKCNFKNNFFDVITMWDLIEHLTNPNKELKEANRILKKDGLLILTTPNINCFFSKITKKSWWGLLRMHLFYFSPQTITKLLKKNGFKVIKIKSYPRTIILKYAIEWFKPYKIIYEILRIIKKLGLENLKLKINTHDAMIIYATKI